MGTISDNGSDFPHMVDGDVEVTVNELLLSFKLFTDDLLASIQHIVGELAANDAFPVINNIYKKNQPKLPHHNVFFFRLLMTFCIVRLNF